MAKKDQICNRKFIQTEAEWSRIFSAWEAGVLLLYPHRHIELQKYHLQVIELFRATPQHPSVAIHFDIEARDRYAQCPYHLDDRDQLHIPLLVQLFCGTTSNKHDLESSTVPPKRAAVPCQNWSLGFCVDPC